jgi:hypothetical protein
MGGVGDIATVAEKEWTVYVFLVEAMLSELLS